MTTIGAAAAWYPDPSNASTMRWWDGLQWTANTRSTDGVVLTDSSAGAGHNATGYAHPTGGLRLQGATSTNPHHYSLITFGVSALYLIIAFFTHFVLIGFVPLAFAL